MSNKYASFMPTNWSEKFIMNIDNELNDIGNSLIIAKEGKVGSFYVCCLVNTSGEIVKVIKEEHLVKMDDTLTQSLQELDVINPEILDLVSEAVIKSLAMLNDVGNKGGMIYPDILK